MSVRNQNVAAVQLSADQLLSEASKIRERSALAQQPRIAEARDAEEHQYEARRRRTEFEAGLRHSSDDAEQWIRYARYELKLMDFRRARSVFERGIAANPSNAPLWLAYARAENKEMSSPGPAGSVLRRATKALPSNQKVWEALLLHESKFGGISMAREVYASWLALVPSEDAFHRCLEFEAKYRNIPIQRALHVRLVNLWPTSSNFTAWAQFELRNKNQDYARTIFFHAIKLSPSSGLLKSFLVFEEQLGCYDRALKLLDEFFSANSIDGINLVASNHERVMLASDYKRLAILCKCATQIHSATRALELANAELDIEVNPKNGEAWVKLIQYNTFESTDLVQRLNEAVSSTCPDDGDLEPRWEGFALVCILSCNCLESSGFIQESGALYKRALQMIPDTFLASVGSEIYFSAAQMELRQNGLTAARKILGQGLGRTASPDLALRYIELEKQLGDYSRCRLLYAKLLSLDTASSEAWTSFANFEASLGEYERSRAIYEAALSMPMPLDNPEGVWRTYADFEADAGEFDRCRSVYNRLLQHSHDASIWLAFAMFELSVGASEAKIDDSALDAARTVFKKGDLALKAYPDQRAALADVRVTFEIEYGDDKSITIARAATPKVVADASGVDYVFPDTEAKVSSLLERARQWKAKTSSS